MIKKPNEIIEELMSMHKHGLPDGSKQGFNHIDQKLRLVKGGTTDLIAYPFHGKSLLFKEWVINLAVNSNWKWLLYTPDDGEDVMVFSDLITMVSGKSFDKNKSNYITQKEINTYTTYLLSAIDFVGSDQLVKPLELFELAASGKYNGLGIDSWNKLNHDEWIGNSAYVGKILTERNRLMRKSGCHCLTVMHPKNPDLGSLRNGLQPPNVYQMYGGSEVNNNANNIVIVFKEDRTAYNEPYIINFNKIKPKQCGEVGEIELYYDYPMRRLYEKYPTSGRREYAKGVIVDQEASDYINQSTDSNPF